MVNFGELKTTSGIKYPTTVEPIATPAAVDAICPKSPGCFGCGGEGCATLEAGLAAGTLEAGFGGARGAVGGALPNIGDDRPLDLLPPRGIIIFKVLTTTEKLTEIYNSCKRPETIWRLDMMQSRFL